MEQVIVCRSFRALPGRQGRVHLRWIVCNHDSWSGYMNLLPCYIMICEAIWGILLDSQLSIWLSSRKPAVPVVPALSLLPGNCLPARSNSEDRSVHEWLRWKGAHVGTKQNRKQFSKRSSMFIQFANVRSVTGRSRRTFSFLDPTVSRWDDSVEQWVSAGNRWSWIGMWLEYVRTLHRHQDADI